MPHLDTVFYCWKCTFVWKTRWSTTKTNICLIDIHVCGNEVVLCTQHPNSAKPDGFASARNQKTSSAITARRGNNKSVSRSYTCESVPKTRCECFWGYPASGVPWLFFEVERRACFLLWCISDGTQIVVDPFLVSISSLFRLQEQVHQFCHRGSEGHYPDFVWRLVLRWTLIPTSTQHLAL